MGRILIFFRKEIATMRLKAVHTTVKWKQLDKPYFAYIAKVRGHTLTVAQIGKIWTDKKSGWFYGIDYGYNGETQDERTAKIKVLHLLYNPPENFIFNKKGKECR